MYQYSLSLRLQESGIIPIKKVRNIHKLEYADIYSNTDDVKEIIEKFDC